MYILYRHPSTDYYGLVDTRTGHYKGYVDSLHGLFLLNWNDPGSIYSISDNVLTGRNSKYTIAHLDTLPTSYAEFADQYPELLI